MLFYDSLVEFWYSIINNFNSAFIKNAHSTSWLDIKLFGNYNLIDLLPQLLSILTYACIFIFCVKIFKSIFYLVLSMIRGR